MDAFPAFFPLAGRKVVVAGSGDAAEAKARLFTDSPAELIRIGEEEALRAGVYDGALLAFIGGEEAFCRAAAEIARAAGALVNVVDRPHLSDFTTPAVVDRGEVVVAIGTTGAAPMMAALLRNDLEARVPQGAGRIAALFKKLQDEVRAAYPDLTERRAFLRQAFSSPAAEAAARGDIAEAERLLRAALAAPKAARTGRVRIIAGAGPADLLSLKAARALAEADILVADLDCDPQIIVLARRDAHRLSPSEIDLAGLAQLAQASQVLRVTTAAPGPLAAALEAEGAAVEILPVAQP